MDIIFEVVFPWLAAVFMFGLAASVTVAGVALRDVRLLACAAAEWAAFMIVLWSAVRLLRLHRRV